MSSARVIDTKEFTEAVGSSPEIDDLERCNCPRAGEPGHMQCGWNEEKHLPVFIAGTASK